jgi:hypothetical protein
VQTLLTPFHLGNADFKPETIVAPAVATVKHPGFHDIYLPQRRCFSHLKVPKLMARLK